jgi:ABC-type multidrug transport system fused ATPase/permease subunit
VFAVDWLLLRDAVLLGVLLGCFYAAVSVGLSISFGLLDVPHVAHPAFLVLASYGVYLCNDRYDIDPLLAGVLIAPLFFLLGVVTYRFYRRHRALDRPGAWRDPAWRHAAIAGGDDFLRSQRARARHHPGGVRGGRPERAHRPGAPVSPAQARSRMTPATASGGPLLRIEALTKSFGGFVALDNVSVEIRKGERFGLIGPNGSGKATLVNCISGVFRPNKGAVLLGDGDITQLPPNERARRGIARSFQIPRPFKTMTVLENLMVALDFAAGRNVVELASHRQDAALSILARMGLESKAHDPRQR